jgi:hypothetical protein
MIGEQYPYRVSVYIQLFGIFHPESFSQILSSRTVSNLTRRFSSTTTMKFTGVLSSLPLLYCCARADKPHPSTVELTLMSSVGNQDGFMYYANITVGTPGQSQTLLIDTGSSNTFVFASNASLCETSGCDGGTFDLSKSSTYEKVNTSQPFWASFMMGRVWFKGDYVRDVFQLSKQKPS